MSATSSGSSTAPAERTTSVDGPEPSSPPLSMFVFTPCGHRQLTRTPREPNVMLNHSANATAACLVTLYGAEPICDRIPAAEAVEQKYPSPRSSHAGTRYLAAQRWAL